jgi:hypothetical protein
MLRKLISFKLRSTVETSKFLCAAEILRRIGSGLTCYSLLALQHAMPSAASAGRCIRLHAAALNEGVIS